MTTILADRQLSDPIERIDDAWSELDTATLFNPDDMHTQADEAVEALRAAAMFLIELREQQLSSGRAA
jgi:hypothetical protein